MKLTISQELQPIEITKLKNLFQGSSITIYSTEIKVVQNKIINVFEPAKIILQAGNQFLNIESLTLLNLLELTSNHLVVSSIEHLEDTFKPLYEFNKLIDKISIFTVTDEVIAISGEKLSKIFPFNSANIKIDCELTLKTVELISFYSKSEFVFAIEANNGWDSSIAIYQTENDLTQVLKNIKYRDVVIQDFMI